MMNFRYYLSNFDVLFFEFKSNLFYYFIQLIVSIVQWLLLIVPLLLAVAYLTLLERKVMAAMQRRRGPNVVGIFGLLQPLADGLKLLLKETIIPSVSNKFIFLFAPMITFFLSLIGWAVIPFDYGMVIADIPLGLLYLFSSSSLGVYGIIIAGWSSNSKYAFLGALRSAAQIISYEVSLGFIYLTILLATGSMNLTEIVYAQEVGVWYIWPFYPLFVLFFVSSLAETNRPPFDLPEAEAELVAGYNVEYSSMAFALFFLGEYANILLMSALCSILFLGGWLPLVSFIPLPGAVWLGLKIVFIAFSFVWVRASLPRYRYDQLMRLGWKIFLPFSFGYFVFVAGIFWAFDWLPY